MKKNIHPKYQQVLFVDSSTGHKFLCGSTYQTAETDELNGKKYPVFRAAISSASHPFFTGSKGLVDAEGRVDKFKKRYAQKKNEKDGEGQSEKETPPEVVDPKAKKKK